MKAVWTAKYDQGIKPEIDLHEYSSLPDVFEKTFKKFSKRPSFHNMGTTLSFAQMDDLSSRFASYLQNDLKLQKGARVALMMPNILQYPICLFGILRAGMVVVNVNPLYTARELQHQLKDSGAETIVIFENSAHVLQSVLPQTDVKNVLVTAIGDFLKFPKGLIVNFVLRYVKKMVPDWNIPGAIDLKTVLTQSQGQKMKKVALNHDDIAFLQYTGGTTGVSKGAVLTHGNIIANVLQAREWIRPLVSEERAEVIITPLPLYHIFSLTANCICFSAFGALNVLITNPKDIPGFIKEIKKWNFTAFTGVNTLFNALTHHEEFKTVNFSHLKVALGGGMAVQKAVAENWKKLTGVPLIEAYGLTETSPAACINPMSLKDYNGFIGLPLPSTVVEIRGDESNQALPFGEVGEICVKGPQVMKGYYNRPDETAKVMTSDGFLRTGDLGFMTPEGFIKIVDRKKDMILVSGFNVYPNEIEDVMVKNPKVLECAAIGVPDEHSGEVVKIFIVKKDPSLTEEEVKSFAKAHLTGYKVPRLVEFRKDLPKSNVGKILRKDLREARA